MPALTLPPDPRAPERVAVLYRPAGKGQRWKKVAVAPDMTAAVALVAGPGNWWLHPLRIAAEEPAGPGLFDDRDETTEVQEHEVAEA